MTDRWNVNCVIVTVRNCLVAPLCLSLACPSAFNIPRTAWRISRKIILGNLQNFVINSYSLWNRTKPREALHEDLHVFLRKSRLLVRNSLDPGRPKLFYYYFWQRDTTVGVGWFADRNCKNHNTWYTSFPKLPCNVCVCVCVTNATAGCIIT
jgi:hypothetical protein